MRIEPGRKTRGGFWHERLDATGRAPAAVAVRFDEKVSVRDERIRAGTFPS